jgi:hypothetical protein
MPKKNADILSVFIFWIIIADCICKKRECLLIPVLLFT